MSNFFGRLTFPRKNGETLILFHFNSILAMIAVSRCVSLTSPDLGEKLFSGRNGKLIILMVWIYANLLVVPAYLGVSIFNIYIRGRTQTTWRGQKFNLFNVWFMYGHWSLHLKLSLAFHLRPTSGPPKIYYVFANISLLILCQLTKPII